MYFTNRRRISLKGCDLITWICLVHRLTRQRCLLSWAMDSSWLGQDQGPVQYSKIWKKIKHLFYNNGSA